MIRRAAPLAGILFAGVLTLAACTPPAATPTAWQQNVQTVADQASSGDYASALASLDALEADVSARRDAGEISAEEADGILSRIATVRADLTSLAPSPSPTPTTEPSPEQSQDTVTDDGGDDSSSDGPADKAPEPGDNGKDKGPGKDGGGPGGGPGKKG